MVRMKLVTRTRMQVGMITVLQAGGPLGIQMRRGRLFVLEETTTREGLFTMSLRTSIMVAAVETLVRLRFPIRMLLITELAGFMRRLLTTILRLGML